MSLSILVIIAGLHIILKSEFCFGLGTDFKELNKSLITILSERRAEGKE